MAMIDRDAHKRLCVAVVNGAQDPPEDIPEQVWLRATNDYKWLIQSGIADFLLRIGWTFVDIRALGCFVMGRRSIAAVSEHIIGFDPDISGDDSMIRPGCWVEFQNSKAFHGNAT